MSNARIVPLSDLQTFTAVQLLRDGGAIGGPVIIPQCAQIAIRWQLDSGKLAHQVLVGRYAGGFAGTVAQANALMTALANSAAATQMLTHIATSCSIAGIDIRDVNTAGQALIQSTNAAVPGTQVASAMPNEMAIVVTLRTAQAGRQFRGRSYVPGWGATNVSTGNIIPANVMTDLQAWANTWISAFSGQGYTLVIGQKHRQAYTGKTGTAHPDRPPGSVQVTQCLVRDNHFDSQRRRGLK